MPGGRTVMPWCDATMGHPEVVPCVGAVRGTGASWRALTRSPSLRAPWGLAEGRCLPHISPWEPGPPGGAWWSRAQHGARAHHRGGFGYRMSIGRLKGCRMGPAHMGYVWGGGGWGGMGWVQGYGLTQEEWTEHVGWFWEVQDGFWGQGWHRLGSGYMG